MLHLCLPHVSRFRPTTKRALHTLPNDHDRTAGLEFYDNLLVKKEMDGKQYNLLGVCHWYDESRNIIEKVTFDEDRI